MAAGQGRNGDFDLSAMRQAVQRMIGRNAVALNLRPQTLPNPTFGKQAELLPPAKLRNPFRKGDGRTGPVPVRDVVGKIWNAPNTAIGLAYGSMGDAVGHAIHSVYPKYPQPRIVTGDNAMQFRDNPFGGVSAITIGNTSTYAPGKDTPESIRHETQHTYQGEKLGPGYLPSNLTGGLMGLLLDRDENGFPDWHGKHNWNERGPQDTPPRPWLPRGR